jgi:AcrR family transcriptional regulator
MKKQKKRIQITETAIRLFSQFGTKRVTIEEICRTAGVSKVTFYKHFKNKALNIISVFWLRNCFILRHTLQTIIKDSCLQKNQKYRNSHLRRKI